jgi:hypothetical protein
MLKLDSDGEGQWERRKISVQQLWWVRDYAKEKQMFCYTWARKNNLFPEGKETFLVLSKNPPQFEPSLQYEVLHDPTA